MAGGLEAYKAKRNFDVTSEPAGEVGPVQGWSFVIQKHAARRLHYDFRLELDGVLKSWAVAKGPSLDPHEKRLAVHVEDHPLDYGGFEGTIPEGQYGAGAVIVWDRGTWTPEGDAHKGYAKGHLNFTLHGEKLHGAWHLVRMKPRPNERGDNWLLMKQEDDAAQPGGDILAEAPLSILSGRPIEDIAQDRKAPRWNSNRAASGPAATIAMSPRRRAAAALAAAAEPEPTAVPTKPAAKQTSRAGKPPNGARKAPQPDFVPPLLATLGDKPPTGPWLHEIKFDGYRLQAVCRDGTVVLRTRNGLDWTDRFPSIARALVAADLGTVTLDGEAIVEDKNGIAEFAGLQEALKQGQTDKLIFYAFDLLYQDGSDLTGVPLEARKERLARLIDPASSGVLRFSQHFDADGATMLRHVCALGAEGIISKRRDSLYRSGRSADWLKAKCSSRQEFVIVGYVPSTTSKKAIGSLVMAYNEGDHMIHAGRVGTGYNERMALDLFKMLAPEIVKTMPVKGPLAAEARRDVVWVAPNRVAEVEFRGWGNGGLIRQASFKGLRDDKEPKDVVREGSSPVAKAAVPTRPDVKLTHPDRVLWSEAGITKDGLADFYTAVWPAIEPHIVGRPLSLFRCPTGVGPHCFFQKHKWDGMSATLKSGQDPKDDEAFVYIDDLAGLMGLVQASVLEIHPWGSRIDDLERPDRLIFDLDPGDGIGWDALAAGARSVREALRTHGLESFVKTSGGKGLHVVVPILADTLWDDAKAFCKTVADDLAKTAPDRFIATMTKAKRSGRIFVDYLRNGRGATAVCAYSTRARPGAGVSTPVSWEELDVTRSGDRFRVGTVEPRLTHLASDPWPGFFTLKQSIPGAAPVTKTTRKRR